MINDGRISRILPRMYFYDENDLIRFVDALDAEYLSLEKSIAGITDLINLDKCPDDKLAYLAALTNCPLIGDDPVLWRKQIKNWPYLLKIKGTELSLDLFLNSIGADDHKISTFFRDANGDLVTEKPDGEPFYDDATGLWRNIRTHLFGFDIFWDEERYSRWRKWDENFMDKINIWVERAKPYHAELIDLVTHIKAYEEMTIYYGMAQGLSGEHKVLIDRAKLDPTQIYYGIAQGLSGEHKVLAHQPETHMEMHISQTYTVLMISARANVKISRL